MTASLRVTKYPFGIGGVDGSTIRNQRIPASSSGKTFYLASTGGASDGNKGEFERPFKTLTGALAQMTDSKGDICYIKAGHTETFTAADGVIFNKIGTTFIGEGNGDSRPKFILGTVATTDLNVTAEGVTIINCIFEAAFADVARCFQVTAQNFTLINCSFQDQEATENFVTYIECTSTTNNNADGLQIVGNEAFSTDTANEQFLKVAADLDRLVFNDNYIRLGANGFEACVEFASGKDMTNCEVLDNNIYRLNTAGDVFIDTNTANNTGIIGRNFIRHADTTSAVTIIDADGCGLFENYSASTDTSSGELFPASASSESGVKNATGSTAVMVSGDNIFTVDGGPIEILSLVSECIALNDATASTLQYRADPTVGAAATFSGASASLANAAAGSGVALNMTALTTAPDVIGTLTALGGVNTRNVTVGAGIIEVVIAVGSTTGTWKHHLSYRALSPGVTVIGV